MKWTLVIAILLLLGLATGCVVALRGNATMQTRDPAELIEGEEK